MSDAPVPAGRILGEIASTEYVRADRHAAVVAERDALAKEVERLRIEIDAVKLFGVGFYDQMVEEATREYHRDLARATLKRETPAG